MKPSTILLIVLMVFFTNPAFGKSKNESGKSYYLTSHEVQGDNVLGQCAEGYHFALVWEILNFSELTYDTELGYTTSESGVSAPIARGWVRAGWGGPVCEAIPGEQDAAWTQAEERMGPSGTLNAWFLFEEAPPELKREGWLFHWNPCWEPLRVWCVSD